MIERNFRLILRLYSVDDNIVEVRCIRTMFKLTVNWI